MSNIATPEMIAAAWDAWKSRPGWKLGPGPAFREAIEAALSVRSKEPELEHHVIADLAARLAKAERERDELRHDVERHIAAILAALDAAGFVVVPREPTEEMIENGLGAMMEWDARTGDDQGIAEVYRAMIAAQESES